MKQEEQTYSHQWGQLHNIVIQYHHVLVQLGSTATPRSTTYSVQAISDKSWKGCIMKNYTWISKFFHMNLLLIFHDFLKYCCVIVCKWCFPELGDSMDRLPGLPSPQSGRTPRSYISAQSSMMDLKFSICFNVPASWIHWVQICIHHLSFIPN